ncbi:MAG TPA: radical SAM protein [Elusimicrobiales bacterium]|nr:radical SAM protein [Elusimicrobiales bacterium]HOL62466.1 radical SAM protein [Elusimicrobiales bacterium]HPO95498.1 radical SAM protein [Elusimicrobiales bacterium]
MRLSEKLYSFYFKNNIPLFVSLEVTRRCVNSCLHCYLVETHNKNYKSERELSLGEIKRIFKELKEIGTIFINITGGEPLLRKDISNIIKLAIEHKFYVKLFSSLNCDFKKIKDIYDIGLRDMDVSLYGSKTIHNQITANDSFDLTVDNIKKAKKLGFRITVKTPVMRQNAGELKWIKKFAKDNYLDFKIDPIITPRNDGDLSCAELSVSDFKFLKNFKNGILKSYDNSFDKIDYVPCGAVRSVIGIDSYGNVLPCLAFPFSLGSLKENKIKDILKSEQAVKLRKKLEMEPEKCIKCNYRTICSRCPGISWLYGKDACYVYEEACRVSKELSRIL